MISSPQRRLLETSSNNTNTSVSIFERTNEYIAHDTPTINKHKLHDYSSMLQSAQNEFEKLADLQSSFSNDVLTIFNTNYLPLSDAQAGAWLLQWPPALVTDVGYECSIIGNAFFLFKHIFNNVSVYYQARFQKTFPLRPTRSLSQSWPKFKKSSTIFTQAKLPKQDDFVTQTAVNGIETLFDFFNVPLTIFFDVLYSVVYQTADSLQCDYENVQMCHNWRVSWFNGIVIVTVYFVLAFLIAQAFGVSSLVIFFVPFFGFFHMQLCYGYQWTCFPLIPNCLIEDIVASINATLPAKIDPIPRALLRSELSACSASALKLQPTLPIECLMSCTDKPYSYTTAAAPFAWWLSEVGANTFVRNHILPHIPWFSTTNLEYHLFQKQFDYDSEQNHLLHRLCASLTFYRLIPYMLLSIVLVSLFLNLGTFIIQIVYTLVRLFVAVFVDAFS